MLNKKYCIVVIDFNFGQEESDFCYKRNICSVKYSVKKINYIVSENEELNKGEFIFQKVVDRIKSENGLQNEGLSFMYYIDGLSNIRLNYSDELFEGGKMFEDEFIDFLEDQDNQDDSSDDGFFVDDSCNLEIGQWYLKFIICK